MTRSRNPRSSTPARARLALTLTAVLGIGVLTAACGDTLSENFQRGYVLPEGALEQIPIGASQDQVLIVLGTPSTVATVSGEAFYYISQRAVKSVAFMPQEVKEQRVIAVYFDKSRRVERLADYGLKDGKVFDYISRTTTTGGENPSFMGYLFKFWQNKGPTSSG
ncbi:MAG TPA: outer membrane protein assembly factor BamE [Pseudolabrys sp.]|nr:outer membrane protein assembly factor BamE [Pseudolabrys sp.]